MVSKFIFTQQATKSIMQCQISSMGKNHQWKKNGKTHFMATLWEDFCNARNIPVTGIDAENGITASQALPRTQWKKMPVDQSVRSKRFDHQKRWIESESRSSKALDWKRSIIQSKAFIWVRTKVFEFNEKCSMKAFDRCWMSSQLPISSTVQ